MPLRAFSAPNPFQNSPEQLSRNRHFRHLEDHLPGMVHDLRPNLDQVLPQCRRLRATHRPGAAPPDAGSCPGCRPTRTVAAAPGCPQSRDKTAGSLILWLDDDAPQFPARRGRRCNFFSPKFTGSIFARSRRWQQRPLPRTHISPKSCNVLGSLVQPVLIKLSRQRRTILAHSVRDRPAVSTCPSPQNLNVAFRETEQLHRRRNMQAVG